jgi:hypothetical protein
MEQRTVDGQATRIGGHSPTPEFQYSTIPSFQVAAVPVCTGRWAWRGCGGAGCAGAGVRRGVSGVPVPVLRACGGTHRGAAGERAGEGVRRGKLPGGVLGPGGGTRLGMCSVTCSGIVLGNVGDAAGEIWRGLSGRKVVVSAVRAGPWACTEPAIDTGVARLAAVPPLRTSASFSPRDRPHPPLSPPPTATHDESLAQCDWTSREEHGVPRNTHNKSGRQESNPRNQRKIWRKRAGYADSLPMQGYFTLRYMA